MIILSNKENCTGCRACAVSCPMHCITGAFDHEGFWYPRIDTNQCVDCHICEKVCPVNMDFTSERASEQYAVYCKTSFVRKKSSSGGIFPLMAKTIIDDGGVVFGAAFDSDFVVRHICIDKYEDIAKLRGSKYVQSDMGDSILQVKTLLKDGKKVLFSGCPCQVNGLLNAIDKNLSKNLITVDFVCHGVPSPKIFKSYLQEKKTNGDIVEVLFRNKRFGWKTYSMKIESKNGNVYRKVFVLDKYMQLYLRNLISRPSCYVCSQSHRSDITLADYWNIAKKHPEMNDGMGITKMQIHSQKGQKLWEEIQNQCVSVRDEFTDLDIQKPRIVPKKRQLIFDNIDKYSFDELYSKYGKRGILYEVKNRVKAFIKIVSYFIGKNL